MTEKKLFANQDTPSIIDTEYNSCNFSHPDPTFVDGKWKSHRLFPGDDTPRIFIGCNLVNCETPPGSTIIGGNCAIIRRRVLQSVSDDIVIDGEAITINHYKRIVYGKWKESGYKYLPSPKEYPFDEEAL